MAVGPGARARWVGRYRESGLGLKRFAEENGLRAAQLHYWVYGGRRPGGESRAEAAGTQPMFREYVVPQAPVGDWGAEIVLPGGASLRLGRGTDPVWAGALLDQMRRPCSH